MRSVLLPFLFLTGMLSAQVVITESMQWTVPAGVDNITIELIGAGGNGAPNGGGGGGGGGYARRTTAVTAGTSYSIVVGTGGSGLGTIVGGMGMFAEAGGNGSNAANPNVGGGGAAGAGVGGTTNRAGGAGGGGYNTYFGGGGGGAAGAASNGGAGGNTIVWTGQCITPGGAGGTSGGGMAGAGGKGAGFTDPNCTVADPAADGGNFGAGGGGGNGNSAPAGTGGNGVCIITFNTADAVTEHSVLSDVSATFLDGRLQVRNAPMGAICTLLDARGAVLWSGAAGAFVGDVPAGFHILQVRVGDEVEVLRVVR